MRKVSFFCILMTIALASCTPGDNNTPSDFSLELTWNTGSLPPEYTYSYVITVGPELKGTLEYQLGYDDTTNVNKYSEDFQITQEDLAQLYNDLQDMFREDWKVGETMEGGPGASLTLSAYDKQFLVPSLSELSGDDYARMDAAIETIREVVPVELWQELQARQQIYEEEYEY